MNKTSKNAKGITLVALVVTIIILLILAGVSIAMLTGKDGLLRKAIEAKEQARIKEYAEKIELIKTELKIKDEGYQELTIDELKTEFEYDKHKNWVGSTQKITDEMDSIEKLKLTTKEGYIFYVTGTATEYKGKNEEIINEDDFDSKVTAKMLEYDPTDKTDSTWASKTDVESALDYLYKKFTSN